MYQYNFVDPMHSSKLNQDVKKILHSELFVFIFGMISDILVTSLSLLVGLSSMVSPSQPSLKCLRDYLLLRLFAGVCISQTR